MGETAWRILLFALVAGASPIALVATFGVLSSGRRANGIAFGTGFMLGQIAAFLTAYLVGTAATANREAHSSVAAALELAFGLLLLALAWQQRRRPGGEAGPGRTAAILERLKGLRPGTAFTAGALLGIGGLKRLTITLVAGATVGIAGLLLVEDLALGLLYILVAGVLVWVPVTVYVVAGDRAGGWMASAEAWLTANERRFTFATTLLFGLLLTADGVVRLL